MISFDCTLFNGFNYYNLTCVILFNINGFKPSKWLNSAIWSMYGILTGTTTPSLRESWSNGNEGVCHLLQSSRTGASLLGSLVSYPGHLWISIFYSSSQLGYMNFSSLVTEYLWAKELIIQKVKTWIKIM